jgi:hypothetical protein
MIHQQSHFYEVRSGRINLGFKWADQFRGANAWGTGGLGLVSATFAQVVAKF